MNEETRKARKALYALCRRIMKSGICFEYITLEPEFGLGRLNIGLWNTRPNYDESMLEHESDSPEGFSALINGNSFDLGKPSKAVDYRFMCIKRTLSMEEDRAWMEAEEKLFAKKVSSQKIGELQNMWEASCAEDLLDKREALELIRKIQKAEV